MDFAKRMWAQIGAQLEGVPGQTRVLIGMAVAVLVLSGALVLMFAGSSETVDVGLAGPNSGEAVAQLNGAGIEAKVDNGMIKVPSESQYQAYLILSQNDLLGESPASAMDRMLNSSSPWETDKSRSQRANNARAQVLGIILSKLDRIKSADVMFDPGKDGIGKRYVPASAMVSIRTSNGAVDSEMADAVASLVSGAIARLDIANVKIVDARTGRRVTVSDPNNMLPSDALKVKRDIEERKRREIENILDYIPGVRVGVNVLMDSVATREERRREYEKEQLIQDERSEETSSRQLANAGEPGPRSNTGLSINGASANGSEQSSNKRETSYYQDKPVVLEQDTVHTGHQIKQINVAVNVPRSFFVTLYQQQNPDAQNEPTDADLTPLVQPELTKIEQKVQVLTLADGQGQVRADMVPDAPLVMTAGASTTVGKLLDGGWSSTAGLALLGLASLALMLKVYRNATRPETLPSIEELAGVPPSLPSDEELIGEAEESEATMTGLELNEDDLRARRIAEQIGDLVRQDPTEASRLLGKWVATND